MKMHKLHIGLIGCGTVGSGVVKLLTERKNFFRDKFGVELIIRKICDRDLRSRKIPRRYKNTFTRNFREVLSDPSVDVVVELIGGLHPAKEIMFGALKNNKHVVTANKELLAHEGKELFREAKRRNREIYFEASVGAGMPIINSITQGLAGNRFNGLYGIINGTSNFILSEMTKNQCTFAHALEEAQRRGFAESNPSLDISGMDSAHKLAILVFLAIGKFIKLDDIYVEGITDISHTDIENAQSLNLVIKLLAIAKKVNHELEVRVHPTLIHKNHPLASVNGIFNAIFLDTDPVGDILLYGQGAGQMSAAAGVVSDLINLATKKSEEMQSRINSLSKEVSKIKLRRMDRVETKFYIRLNVIDKPGVLSKISGILGKHDISIASVTQRDRKRASAVPIMMLTHLAKERKLKLALEDINRLAVVRSKPVAIRMERL